MKKSNLYKIGLTHGDYNGVGYEVILKTLSDDRILEHFIPIVYGVQEIMEQYQKLLSIDLSKPVRVISDATNATEGVVNLVPISTKGVLINLSPGVSTGDAGTLAARALLRARGDLMANSIDAVVTAPINKDNTQGPDFNFPGHTEFFADPYPHDKPLMLFSSAHLPVVGLATTHIPLGSVSSAITEELLLDYLVRLEKAVALDFCIPKPRIAVLGLNPHAGENGLLGHEEVSVIRPVVQKLFARGMLIFGPYPADGLWGSGAYTHFDVVVSMYHDQGLIPFKLLAMDDGVNITCGLPIVRTSPDHGTAYDIAGKGKANPASFRAAIFRAIDIIRSRKRNDEVTANPLVEKYHANMKEDRHR